MVYLDGADLYNYDKVTVAKFTEIYSAPPKYIKEPANIDENPPFSPAWHEAQSAAGKALREFLADLKRLATKAQTRRLFICREQPQFAVGVNSDQITSRVGIFHQNFWLKIYFCLHWQNLDQIPLLLASPKAVGQPFISLKANLSPAPTSISK